LSEVEVRRVQRVGSSSLVVTLPKEWARRLGIKQGSRVMLVNEGDSIRLVPVERDGGRPVKLDLSRAPGWLARAIPLCVYLSGLSEAEVVLPGESYAESIRAKSLDLMALQVYDVAPGRVRMEVLIDSQRIDLPRLTSSLSGIARRAAGLLAAALRGEDISRQLATLKREFLRTNYVVLRYLSANTVAGGVASYHSALATSYAGFAVDLLLETAALASNLGLRSEEAAGLAEEVGAAMESLFSVLAQPSTARLSEVHEQLMALKARAVRLMASPEAAAAAAKLHDALRLVTIAGYVAMCRVLLEGAGGS